MVLDSDIQKKFWDFVAFFYKLKLKKPPNCKKILIFGSLSFMQHYLSKFIFGSSTTQWWVLIPNNKSLRGITAEPRKTYLKPEKKPKAVIHLKTGKTLNGHNSKTVISQILGLNRIITVLSGHVYLFRLKCWHFKKVQNQIFCIFFFPKFLEPENYWKHVSPYCDDPSTFFKESVWYNRLKMAK